MDKQMYTLIKNAMKDGKSVEDVVSEINLMAQAAQKELQPPHPIQDKYGKPYPKGRMISYADNAGMIPKDRLIPILARYYVQNGFKPDVCYTTEDDFLDVISRLLDSDLAALKSAERAENLRKAGVSQEDISKQVLSDFIGAIFDETASQFYSTQKI